VVEGPTELELVGPERAFLHHGVAVIRLPPGGAEFELETPTARVLGGGEFGAKVDASLTTDVQVYLGTAIVSAVATLGGGQFPERFGAGEAVRISSRADAVPARIAFAEQRFLRRVPDDTAGQGVGVVAADDPKAGRASRESIVVTRPQTPVVIDGRLEEWDAAPGFRRSRHGGTHDSEWIEGRMMYDAERLYVAARVGDPLPMRNSVDHAFDAGLVWQGGGLQLFFSGDRAAGWPADANAPGYYENRKRVASFAERVKAENPRLMTLIMTHHAPSGTDRLFIGRSLVGDRTTMPAPDAFEGRFRMHPDGRGYVLEYAIPWSTLGLDDDPPQPGDDLAVAWELHFSEETGRLWRDQIVDVRNPAEPWDIFLFERVRVDAPRRTRIGIAGATASGRGRHRSGARRGGFDRGAPLRRSVAAGGPGRADDRARTAGRRGRGPGGNRRMGALPVPGARAAAGRFDPAALPRRGRFGAVLRHAAGPGGLRRRRGHVDRASP
jgi:hypothetical protein